jgi:hypothetical protein
MSSKYMFIHGLFSHVSAGEKLVSLSQVAQPVLYFLAIYHEMTTLNAEPHDAIVFEPVCISEFCPVIYEQK